MEETTLIEEAHEESSQIVKTQEEVDIVGNSEEDSHDISHRESPDDIITSKIKSNFNSTSAITGESVGESEHSAGSPPPPIISVSGESDNKNLEMNDDEDCRKDDNNFLVVAQLDPPHHETPCALACCNDSNSNISVCGGIQEVPLIPVMTSVIQQDKSVLKIGSASMNEDISDSGDSLNYAGGDGGENKSQEYERSQPIRIDLDSMNNGHLHQITFSHQPDYIQNLRESVVIQNFDTQSPMDKISSENYDPHAAGGYSGVIRTPPEEYLYHPNNPHMAYRIQHQPLNPYISQVHMSSPSSRHDYLYGDNLPYAQIPIEKIQNPGHWGNGHHHHHHHHMSLPQSEKGCSLFTR